MKLEVEVKSAFSNKDTKGYVVIGEIGKYDRYKRLIAVVINEKNENVNKELIKAGLAWHFKKYSTDASYDELEKVARQDRKGLWVVTDPTPPWNWRRRR